MTNTSVRAQIVVDLELNELSVNGTQLDLLGLSTEIKKFLEGLPMNGAEMRVIDVGTTTKAWEINSQLEYGKKFEPTLAEGCACTLLDRLVHSIDCPLHWRKAPHSRACDMRLHEHGPLCHTNCPSCHGRVVRFAEPV